jgi:transposase
MKQKKKAIGVDISKDKFDVCFVDEDDKNTYKKYSNNKLGISMFAKDLHNDIEVPIVMESTGRHHLLVAITLTEQKYSVYVINPILTKQYSSARVRKCKTDRIDSEILSKIAISEKNNLIKFKTNNSTIYIKNKVHLIEKMKKNLQITVTVIKEYQSTMEVIDKKDDTFIKSLKTQVKELKKIIEKEETLICKQVVSDPVLEELDSIEGVSRINAIKILSHLSDKTFQNRDQVVAFAGLDITKKESGSSVHGKGRISKRGNPILRKILFQSSWGMIMHSKEYREMFDQYRSKGHHYYTCLIIISRKLLRKIFYFFKKKEYSLDFSL